MGANLFRGGQLQGQPVGGLRSYPALTFAPRALRRGKSPVGALPFTFRPRWRPVQPPGWTSDASLAGLEPEGRRSDAGVSPSGRSTRLPTRSLRLPDRPGGLPTGGTGQILDSWAWYPGGTARGLDFWSEYPGGTARGLDFRGRYQGGTGRGLDFQAEYQGGTTSGLDFQVRYDLYRGRFAATSSSHFFRRATRPPSPIRLRSGQFGAGGSLLAPDTHPITIDRLDAMLSYAPAVVHAQPHRPSPSEGAREAKGGILPDRQSRKTFAPPRRPRCWGASPPARNEGDS